MGRVTEYLRRAEEVERMARQISLNDERAAMLEIARQWRVLAARINDDPDEPDERQHPDTES